MAVNDIPFLPFMTTFTPGQITFMRETILFDPNFQDIRTTVESLYHPYAGSYYDAGPNNGDVPLFQPGFNYLFVQCGGTTETGIEVYNQPTAFNDTSFSFDASTIIKTVDRFSLELRDIFHPNNSAIIIGQLNPEVPRHCYNNFNREAIHGTIIKFKDNIPNNNIEVYYLDASEANSSTLIQSLPEGLYNITKEYTDGSCTDKTILKTNNE